MKIKFILAKLLRNWSTKLDQNILEKSGYYHIIKWYNDIKYKATFSDYQTTIDKLSTIYADFVENGLGNSHLSKFVTDKIQEIEKELENIKKQSNQPKEENLTSDQILQNALDKGKKERERVENHIQDNLFKIKETFLAGFKKWAFNHKNEYEAEIKTIIYIEPEDVKKFLIQNVEFLKKCSVEVNIIQKSINEYYSIKVKFISSSENE